MPHQRVRTTMMVYHRAEGTYRYRRHYRYRNNHVRRNTTVTNVTGYSMVANRNAQHLPCGRRAVMMETELN